MPTNQERVAMITGGNGGIGFATVKKLAAKGYHVFLASRNQEASRKAIEHIHAEQPDATVESIPLDLASFESIRACVSAFQAKRYPLHLLINNAGQMFDSKEGRFTADGFEITFGVNHLGHFLLTNLLLEDLKRSAPARVITVSSSLHDPALKQGPPTDFDYDNLKAEKYFDAQVFYKNSKLANIWFAYELNRLLEGTGVTSNAVCPGFVPAAIGARRKSPFSKFFFTQILAQMPFARSLDEASDSYLVAATKPKFGSEGGYFIVDGEEKRSSDESYDEEKAHILWEKSLAWCGLDGMRSV
ncbi:MAG: SDR family NAD(P)-dependent oxidoreductase [Anaerolineae bacterium]|jgi:NAD(P)-dependent dehydrogenase (short-subunit alcohol dehydrogenase family)|nr:SDR family NAD(P)-dependent oxidoreductase [Anaerolineae bacterium]MBT7074082.1 SDR family NAD(P)-dependent oxidoreductase [Anaerolineae bacterium]